MENVPRDGETDGDDRVKDDGDDDDKLEDLLLRPGTPDGLAATRGCAAALPLESRPDPVAPEASVTVDAAAVVQLVVPKTNRFVRPYFGYFFGMTDGEKEGKGEMGAGIACVVC